MAERVPITRAMKASETRQQWSQVLNRVFRRQLRVVVEKSGIPVAVIISADDLERFRNLEEERARDFSVLDEVNEAFKEVPDEEIDREVARALADVRAERKREEPRL
jgi:prevent-host-death family protein